MIDYGKVKIGDKFKIVGAGAPGFAKLGDVVTAESVQHNRVDVRHDDSGKTAYFALTCGAARLEPYDPFAAVRPVETEREYEPNMNPVDDAEFGMKP